jgi:hypothetical protein
LKWWRNDDDAARLAAERTIEIAETVRDESETLRRKAEELKLAAEALIDQNSDHMRGAV